MRTEDEKGETDTGKHFVCHSFLPHTRGEHHLADR